MISIYNRIESITMNSNTEGYTSGPPALTRTMSNAPPTLSRAMSVAPSGDTDMQLDMGEDDDEEYETMRDIYRMKQAGNAALLEVEEIRMFKNYIARQKRLLLDQYAVVSDKLDELGERGWLSQNSHELTRTMSTAPPGLARTMSTAPSTDMDIQLDLGEGSEYDTMRDIGGMKQLGLASTHEISIFNEYVYQLKSQHAATCNMLEELGERGWLIQNSHELARAMSTAPPGLARSVTISIPSDMDVDQSKGPIALTQSVNIVNDIFGFTQTESPLEPNFGVKMDVDMDPDMSIEEE